MISRVSHFSSSTSGMGSGLVIEDHVRRGKADHKHQELLLKVQGCHICLLSVEVNCVVPLHGRTAYDVAEVHLWLETGVFRATYGSVSAGREKWPFNVLFFFKSRDSV